MEPQRAKGVASIALLLVLIGVSIGALGVLASADEDETDDPTALEGKGPISGSDVRRALDALGGVEAITLGTAVGTFDIVRFDPLDSNRLLASRRSSYGIAENQRRNELWNLVDGDVEQTLWAPDAPHDFAHFNSDGTITRWVHGGGRGFAPRVAQILDRQGNQLVETNPIYASRFVVDNETVFALTGDGDYGGELQPDFVALIADDGTQLTTLTSASGIGAISSPALGLLVSYPTDATGRSRVWNSETLTEISNHALAGRRLRGSAISADGATAVGVNFEGEMEVIDLRRGDVTHRFGSVQIDGIDQPITLSCDGRVAVTIDRSGTVDVWWVPDGSSLLSIEGEAVQPRWVSESIASRSATAVAACASRLAVRKAARPGVPTTWSIIDVDIESWLARAGVE